MHIIVADPKRHVMIEEGGWGLKGLGAEKKKE